ncbi:minor capsid protein [Streptomyces mirabilis]
MFVEVMPPAPDAAVALWLYDGEAPDTRNAYDTPRLQVRVRGGPDPRVSRRRTWAIYSALHGLAGVALADGTWLVLAAARGTPAPMGPDSNGRHEHVVNFDLDVSAPPHRPSHRIAPHVAQSRSPQRRNRERQPERVNLTANFPRAHARACKM